MNRLLAVALAMFATVAAWPSGVAQGALTPSNSVVAPLALKQSVRIEGVGCGVSASGGFNLPLGAFDARVRRPAVGDRALDTAVAAVGVQGGTVVVTVIADGASICDPASGSDPPASRPWFDTYATEVGFRQRLGVVHWNRDRVRGRAFVVRPPEVRVNIFVGAQGIRWVRFGGRRAVGLGRFRSFIPCAGGCTDNGTRLRVELTRPGRCPGMTRRGQTVDAVFYTKVAFILRERLGILKPGREWFSTRLACPPGGSPPILIP
jgi:hypothetical protein